MLAILRLILLEAVPLTAHGLFAAALLFELLSNKAALEATFLRLGSLRSILFEVLPGGARLLLFLFFMFLLLKKGSYFKISLYQIQASTLFL